MKYLYKNQKGFTLIEVLVGIAIIGIIASAFLFAIATAGKANIIADERATAESLTRAQMEYVKAQSYIVAENGEVVYGKLGDIPEHYEIWSYDREGTIVEDIIGVPWDSQNYEATTTDIGLQRIFLVIKHNGKIVLEIEEYKVDR
jgi:prepilin-type N-terminal cleavage/methylation domain-containing protein